MKKRKAKRKAENAAEKKATANADSFSLAVLASLAPLAWFAFVLAAYYWNYAAALLGW